MRESQKNAFFERDPVFISRHTVTRSSRLLITEKIISGLSANKVLELDAEDHSFKGASANSAWMSVEIAPPCYVVCDFSGQ
jgi:hypothetical protein